MQAFAAEPERGVLGRVVPAPQILLDQARVALAGAPKPPPPGVETATTSPAASWMSCALERCGGT